MRSLHNITDLVCYTNSHWFFKHECQHIFGKQMGYIFQSSKNGNMVMDDKKITLYWIKSIIRNNKCIFAKLNAVFVLKTVVRTKKNITTDNSVTNTWSIQQTPIFHGCTITWWTSQFQALSFENFWCHGTTPKFCLHVATWVPIRS
jgi:hypothetical protein